MSIGERLRKARTGARLSLTELGRILELDRITLYRYEHGRIPARAQRRILENWLRKHERSESC